MVSPVGEEGAQLGVVVAMGSTILLRRPQQADRAAWGRLLDASRDFLAPWIDLPAAGNDPRGAAWFDATLAAVDDPRYEKLFVVPRDGGDLVGVLNLNEIVRGSFESAYLGYWIGAEHARKGLMTEGLELGLRHAFGVLGLHRVEANLQPENEASRALVSKTGFVREGLSERYLRVGGHWRDHERWALTVERWTEHRCLRDADLRLRPLRLHLDTDIALPWYADPEVLRFSESGAEERYSRATVQQMFEVLATKGEVFIIEIDMGNAWRPIGDVTLSKDGIPIAIGDPQYRSRGFGTRTLALLIQRASALGWDKLVTNPIELSNERSVRLFASAGFMRAKSARGHANGGQAVVMEKALVRPTSAR